jgi:AMP nucleosidase
MAMNHTAAPHRKADAAAPSARDLETFDDAAAAVARIAGIYDRSLREIRGAFAAAAAGGEIRPVSACYPYVGVPVGRSDLHVDARLSYGVLL